MQSLEMQSVIPTFQDKTRNSFKQIKICSLNLTVVKIKGVNENVK